MSDLVRVDLAQVKISRPDGTTMEYSGPASELTVLVAQLEDEKPGFSYAQLLQWASKAQKLQPLFVALGICIGGISLLIWATKPAIDYYQPQSQGGNYEYVA